MNDNAPLEENPNDRWSRREERREARRARREPGFFGTWVGGLVLVLLGVVFLVQNVSGLDLGNWWALFILIGAAGSFANAWSGYRSSEQFSASVRSSFIGGLVLTLVACIFLFNLDWGKVWPVFLIIVGISTLLAAVFSGGRGNLND